MDRATLKIEIPFTDHAHCIGRQGNQIQSIMTATKTHIHFPDGNREPNGIKSNQVSITGNIISIEQARKRLKEILPMSLKFLLPSGEFLHSINDNDPLFQTVRTRFNVNVLSRTSAKTGDVYCIIRGLIHQTNLVEATDYLIQSFYGCQSALIQVTCQIEVNEQYHEYLQTRQEENDMSMASIEQYTQTRIEFPAMINNGYERRTSVIITGSTASQVCQARKFFDLCLPIILTFEIPVEQEPTYAELAYMKEKLNVTTILRTRKHRIGKLINIQTQEFNSERLFHARSIILDLPAFKNQILPLSLINNRLVDLDSTSIFSPNLSLSTESLISSSSSDSLLIPIESCYFSAISPSDTFLLPLNEIIPTKKPSPIGYERSLSFRNLEQDPILWPTDTDQLHRYQQNS